MALRIRHMIPNDTTIHRLRLVAGVVKLAL